ncbi:hypothetical protein DPSP01_008765 [Paraphaeosphaeria sporulosa]
MRPVHCIKVISWFSQNVQGKSLKDVADELGDAVDKLSCRRELEQVNVGADLEAERQSLHGTANGVGAVDNTEFPLQRQVNHLESALHQRTSDPEETDHGVILVDWYTQDDPKNLKNWPGLKKGFVGFILSFYTAAVYAAGLFYATSVGGGLLEHFNVSPVTAFLGLSLFILTYGIGDIVLALCFFESRALANGGATVSDLFELIYIPYGLSYHGKGWRWSSWEISWISLLVVILLILMPETSPENILFRRARRLRKFTGNSRLQYQSEIAQHHMLASQILTSALICPLEIMFKDPSVFVNVYTGYLYGVFYTFFEIFSLVFPRSYGFNPGQTGLTFLSYFVGITIALLGYFAYLHWYMIPDNMKAFREQEHCPFPALIGSVLLPAGLFIFAWTADPDIHWVVPLTDVANFCVGHFWLMQSLVIYFPISYPKYAASLFAGNRLWRRSITVGASVVFATLLFTNLGIRA